MNTEEVIRRLSSESIDEQLAVLRSLLGKDPSPEVYPLLMANLTSQDDGVVFLSLTLMIKGYPARVHQDGEQLRPQFLALLTSGHGPIIDRVIWGLSITGPDSVPMLIEYILQSLDDLHLEIGIWALGGNGYIRQYPALVVDTIRVHLSHSNPRIRCAALSVLIDMSPLRPFHRLDVEAYHFEPVYQELQAVAQDLFASATTSEEKEWLGQYLELLNNRSKQ
jgi:HEAT repeat protein